MPMKDALARETQRMQAKEQFFSPMFFMQAAPEDVTQIKVQTSHFKRSVLKVSLPTLNDLIKKKIPLQFQLVLDLVKLTMKNTHYDE